MWREGIKGVHMAGDGWPAGVFIFLSVIRTVFSIRSVLNVMELFEF